MLAFPWEEERPTEAQPTLDFLSLALVGKRCSIASLWCWTQHCSILVAGEREKDLGGEEREGENETKYISDLSNRFP